MFETPPSARRARGFSRCRLRTGRPASSLLTTRTYVNSTGPLHVDRGATAARLSVALIVRYRDDSRAKNRSEPPRRSSGRLVAVDVEVDMFGGKEVAARSATALGLQHAYVGALDETGSSVGHAVGPTEGSSRDGVQFVEAFRAL